MIDARTTPLDLQKAIQEDLQALFGGERFKASSGELSKMNVFRQNLPMRTSEDDPDPVPYIIVRLDSGEIESQTDPQNVVVILIVGIFDDSPENNGHDGVMHVITKIQRHFEGTPIAGGAFVMQDPFDWALQDEESYPYFFGAATTTWSTPAPRRDWSQYT